MLFWSLIEEITELIQLPFWHGPENLIVLQTLNFEQRSMKGTLLFIKLLKK